MSSPSHHGSEDDDPRQDPVPPPLAYGTPPPPPQSPSMFPPPPPPQTPLSYPPHHQVYGAPAPYPPPGYAPVPAGKPFVVTWLLSLFLGIFGADRFFLGKAGTAVLKLVTCGGAGIWYLVDLLILLTGNMRDMRGAPLTGYEENKKVAWIVTAVFLLIVIGGAG